MNEARRKFLMGLAGMGLSAVSPWHSLHAATTARQLMHLRPIPSTAEEIPVLGLGSWITFDVSPADRRRRQQCQQVMQEFLSLGGRMIDSSPMYGYSQAVIGEALRQPGMPGSAFSATKVWIPGAALGEAQMEQALKLWGLKRFDLVHVHNMVDWQGHLPWLRRWKENGKLRYVGISTSHGRRHAEMAEVIRSEGFDMVQFTYNLADREAEDRLLPLALEHGKAVVINRPFRGGELFRQVRNRPLPAWAAEWGYSAWAQIFLAWVVSHPAVTCAIPATSQPEHLRENMVVLTGRLPDAVQRDMMLDAFLSG